jgi:hypothetical protein
MKFYRNDATTLQLAQLVLALALAMSLLTLMSKVLGIKVLL